MTIKFIQVNIYKGKYLMALVDFLLKESPDIISMQEVTTGELSAPEAKNLNLLDYLEDKLGYGLVYHGDSKLKDSDATFGNAVLTKFPVVDSKIVVLAEFRPVTKEEIDSDESVWGRISRHVLDAIVEVGSQRIHAMSWHGAWTAPPTDTEETIRQAKLVTDYLKSLSEPFILGCDSNAVMQSKTIETIGAVSKNLLEGSGVLQTTHPKVHKIVPRGYLIDFIFTSDHFKLKSLRVPDVTVSDHLPVVAELEFDDKVL